MILKFGNYCLYFGDNGDIGDIGDNNLNSVGIFKKWNKFRDIDFEIVQFENYFLIKFNEKYLSYNKDSSKQKFYLGKEGIPLVYKTEKNRKYLQTEIDGISYYFYCDNTCLKLDQQLKTIRNTINFSLKIFPVFFSFI